MSNEDAAIGALVRQYAANEKTIAALLSELDGIGKGLRLLGDALRDGPDRIAVLAGEFQFEAMGQRRGVPDTLLEAGVIREHLGELSTALGEKQRMEDRLRRAGMENLINQQGGG